MRESTRYIPTHMGIMTHRKTYGAAAELGISREQFIGHLITLKIAVTVHLSDGILRKWDHEHIARMSNWAGDAGHWVSALVEWEWLDDVDGQLELHDWAKYEGTAEQKEAAAERQRRHRAKARAAQGQGPGDEEPEPEQAEATAPAPPKAKKATSPRKTIDDLLREPYKGHTTAAEYFRLSYPWYDGRPGRPSLQDHYAQMAAWYGQRKTRRWETPAGIAAWLDRDTPRCKGMWEREQGIGGAAGVVVTKEHDPEAEAKTRARNRWQVLSSLGHQLPPLAEWYRQGCPEPEARQPERAQEPRKEPEPSPTRASPIVRLLEAPIAPEPEGDFVPVDQVRDLMKSLGASRQKSAAALKAEADLARLQRLKKG
jgi:hypothetical protein